MRLKLNLNTWRLKVISEKYRHKLIVPIIVVDVMAATNLSYPQT